VPDTAVKVGEARLRWHGYVISRDEEEPDVKFIKKDKNV
jgi:hypothetical protein